MARGVGVDVPESETRGNVDGWLRVEGSITFVRFGRGEEGREGGSWVGAGVSADIVRFVCGGGEG